MVDSIRAFMKRSQPSTSIVAMNDLMQGVLTLTRQQIFKGDVSLRTELAVDLNDTLGDPIQLQQVMVNLIVNAIEAISGQTTGQRELLVTSHNEGPDQILISVRDSGVGVDLGSVEELFKPFVTSKSDGMGMGLPISRSIIEAHGGKLWAVPNQGQGATFQFSLPVNRTIGVGR